MMEQTDRLTLTRREKELAHKIFDEWAGDFDWDLAWYLNENPQDQKVLEQAVAKFAAYVKPALRNALDVQRELDEQAAAEDAATTESETNP